MLRAALPSSSFFAVVVTCAAALLACSSGSTVSSTGSGADGGGGGIGSTGSGGTTLSCLVQLNGFEPQCQFYEATGADGPRTIESIRNGCVDQADAKASVLEVCPSADVLGGCKRELNVKGATDVKLFATNFEYKPSPDAGAIAHKTTEEMQSFCTSQGAAVTFVASP